jgi:hypothetical protein
MTLWEKLKKDIEKEVKAGIKAMKAGTATIKEKTEKFTEEAKRQFQILELKSKLRNWMTELGGRVYEIKTKLKNPMFDSKVKMIIKKIQKLETQIGNLEKKRIKSGKISKKKRFKKPAKGIKS